MKKHIFRIMIVMLFACLGLTAFVACAPKENKETFTVTYVAGEGTGTGPASEKHAEGETFTVAENTFTYEGYTFKTWNDGTNDVAAGATYTMPAKDVTFTAKWTKNATPAEKVTVTFSLGDYTTGTVPAAQEVEKGAQVTLPEAPAWAGHVFAGWKVGTNAALKQAGDKIKVSENVTITAQWTEEVTVTFSLGEGVTGNPPASQTVAKNGEITLPAEPTRSGYDFVGWKVGDEVKAAGDKITVTASMTVTAQWDASIVGYWSATGLELAIPEMTGACDVEIAVERDGSDHLYVVLNLTNGQTSHLDAFYIEKVGSAWQYYNYIVITLQDGKLHVKIQSVEFDLATHTAFTDEFTPTGTYSATVEGSEYYMDFDQWGYDSGNGYMDDVDFVTVGKYVAVFESTQDDVPGSLAVLLEGESGAIEGYDDESNFATFTACEAREKTVSYNVFELEQEDDRAYVIIEGTYAGFTPSGLRDLQEDQVIEEYNISLFLKKTPWSIYPNVNTGEGSFVNRELTIAAGVITAKFDVTDLPITDVGYGAAAMNNGSGDLSYGSTPSDYTFRIGDTVYTLKGSSGNVVLNVEAYNHATDWTGVSATPTTITLTLNDAKDKVLLTVSGTYTGTTKEHMKELLSQKYNNLPIIYFWGWDNGAQEGKDLVITTTDTEWTVQLDVTELKSDNYENDKVEGTVIQNATPGDGINGRENTSPGNSTEFRVQSVVDTTVECGGRAFTLVRSGLDGHNTIYVGTPVTVTYDLGGWDEGTALAPVKVARSAGVVLPELEEREGYIFKGWKVGTDDNGDVIKQAGERLAVSADITITAVWAEAVTVTYSLGGVAGEVPQTQKVEKGSQITLPAVSVPEDYTFLGWKVGDDTALKQAEAKVTVSQNVTITAQWKLGTIRGYWTATGVDGTIFGETGNVGLELAIEEGEGGVYVVQTVTVGGAQKISVMFFQISGESYICSDLTLTREETTLTITKGEKSLAITTRVAFGQDNFAPTGAYRSQPEGVEKEYYFDVAYKAVDLGVGYLVDAKFVTVGKYFVCLAEKGETTESYIFVAGTDGAPTATIGDKQFAFTACEARAKNVVLTLFTLTAEGDKAYLTMSGTYVGFKASELYELSDDEEYEILNISVFLDHSPWTTYPNPKIPATQIVPRVHTIGDGKISAKLDITQLPNETYGLAPRNDGVSDCLWGSNTPQEITIGNRKFAIGSNYGKAQLSITSGTVIATNVTIGLDNENASQATKVLLTVKGTYTGKSKADVEEILSAATIISFWGSKGQTATCTSTVDENGTWTIVVDITNLQDDGDMAIIASYNGVGKINDREGTEFHFDWVQDQSVTFQGKTYSLKKTGGAYGHNCVSVTAAAE